ncbi:MAG TPA: sigma-54 dependent transcriptional regulator [Candidatus Hydrogenedentes bacterium]|nr:sigma-54 dependent transcriptional regulator [Candidatus Hydrogenedentota bacterium]
MTHRVLVVDDELGMREVMEIVLQNAGYEVHTAVSVEEACRVLEETPCDAVLTDLYMGNDRQAGMRLLSWIQEHAPNTPAIMMTAYGSVDSAIEAVKRGATDYVMKPFKNDEIRIMVERAIAERDLRRENEALRKDKTAQLSAERMISPGFQDVLNIIQRVAKLPSTIAVHGESGVGKELVARTLHDMSDRADRPFVAINCGGIPETLLESELFGHKKGAFTGAIKDKEGLFVIANGGTVFLDEIGEMPLILQAKLLRVLDNHTITPLGGTAEEKVDVRIISATNRNLEKMVEEGRFRNDLFYRLNVIPIDVPPLRERPDDIPLFAEHFVQKHAAKIGRRAPKISPDAMNALRGYSWPGNVRELGNLLERVVVLCGNDCIELSDLPANLQEIRPTASAAGVPVSSTLPPEGVDLESMVADLECALIKQALEKSHYSQKKAAQLLKLTPRSLRYRLKKYGMEAE